MKNNKKILVALGLALSIVVGGVFSNNIWAMEQQMPIYEVLARKKVEEKIRERTNNPRNNPNSPYFKPFDLEKYYAELLKEYLEKYKEYEGDLEEVKPMPEALVWGGINYGMTLEEMKQKIKATFSEMKNNGLIMSKDQFEKIKDRYFLKYPRTNLTRVWGSEYLKKKINADPGLSKSFDVPGYIIVVDDPDKISVKISFSEPIFPIVKQLNNGEIYFEKIEGKGIAVKGSPLERYIGRASGIGYVDFGDPGNIIEQEGTQKWYVVDTEYNSFDIKIDSYLREILEYASERFKYLNNEKSHEAYEFDI